MNLVGLEFLRTLDCHDTSLLHAHGLEPAYARLLHLGEGIGEALRRYVREMRHPHFSDPPIVLFGRTGTQW